MSFRSLLLRPVSRSVWSAPLAAALMFGMANAAESESESANEPAPAESAEDAGTDDAPPEAPPLSEEEQRIADELIEKLDEGTEARAMLDAILTGAEMGPRDGWFALSQGTTRYTWEALSARYDLDQDGKIVREEFPGPDADFQRLDRDSSGAIDPADLKWEEHALAGSPVTQLFYWGDEDGNGKLTHEEIAALFLKFDRDKVGELSLDDLKAAFAPRPPSGPGSDGPTREMLLKGLIRQEIGAWNEGPAIGETAPDFTLRTHDGLEDVSLRSRHRNKPLVLVFGNFTCGPFRAHSGNVERVHRRYRDQAEFLTVYVREAHPTDGWQLSVNETHGVTLPQPQTQAERESVAQQCQARLRLPWDMVVDTIDDAAGQAYSGMPSRLYVIDRAGVVVYKSGRGPFGFKPAEMEQSLIWLLSEGGTASDPAGSGTRATSSPGASSEN
ncbi:MAG: deiodinase family protein [Planctomyces sp.]|nr:deiodinase family protein [Planctomyces sp.]